MRTLIITSMRNEAAFILEWLAYYKLIGVTDFLIYSNDCDDGTDAMLDHLQDMGIVTHQPNPRSGKKAIQWKALNRARNHPLTKKSDWIFVTDVDEFLCIHAGDGTLQDLRAAAPEADAFALSWRMFGHNNQHAYTDDLMMSQFTQCAPEAMLWPWRAVQYKTLWRNIPENLDKLGVHRPHFKDGTQNVRWSDGNGRPLRRALGTIVPSVEPRYDLAQINHYALSSVENFLLKADRGKPNHSSDPTDYAYWIERDFNQIEDSRILKFETAVRAQVQEWCTDDRLKAFHETGVEWRQNRIATLMQDLDWFYMYSGLVQAGPTQVLPMEIQQKLFSDLIRLKNPNVSKTTTLRP